MAYRYEFGAGAGKNAFETVNPADPSEKVGRYAVEHDSIAGQEEILCPVVSVIEYDAFDRAMEILNGTEFGLTSALFSNRNDLVQRFLAESRHGMMHANHGTVPDNNMPFGGIKNSEVGAYSVGPTAVNFYTSEHSAYIAG